MPLVEEIEKSLQISCTPDCLGVFLFGIPMFRAFAEEHGIDASGKVRSHPESEDAPEMKKEHERDNTQPKQGQFLIAEYPQSLKTFFEVCQRREQEADPKTFLAQAPPLERVGVRIFSFLPDEAMVQLVNVSPFFQCPKNGIKIHPL